MALRFFDGFDYYTSSDMTQRWTTVSNQVIQSATTRFGVGQSCKLSGIGVIKKTIDSQSTWIIGVAAQVPLAGAAGGTVPGNIIELFSSTTRVAAVFLSLQGILSVIAYDNGAGAHTMCTGTRQLGPNQWYFFEFKFSGGATINVVNTTVKINGVQDSTFAATSGGSTSAASTMDTIKVLGPLNANYFYDDFYACDGTSGINNDFLGDIRVGTTRPSGAGFQTDWTPDTGTNFSRVNEAVEDGDTSYVTANSANLIDSYAHDSLPGSPQTIFGVQVTAVGKNDAGSHTFDTFVRISSTSYLSSDFTLTGSYAFYTQFLENSPATSSAWGTTEVANMEVGLKLVS